MNNLIGIPPADVLLHGPKKTYIDTYHWHVPTIGIIGSYAPTAFDVEDHFDIFRGVDQIEAFAQTSVVSCGAFNESIKQKRDFDYLKQTFLPLFVSIGSVNFHNYIALGDVFICMGQIKFYKFRQMIADGRIYKVPKGLDLNSYFSTYSEQQFLAYELSNDFTLVAELFDIIGQGKKKSKF